SNGFRPKLRRRYCAITRPYLSLLGRIALRFRELIIVFLRANRVGHREGCQRVVKGAALSHVSCEHSWIGRARMRAVERAPAQASVVGLCILFSQFVVGPEPLVLQAHVEMPA